MRIASTVGTIQIENNLHSGGGLRSFPSSEGGHETDLENNRMLVTTLPSATDQLFKI